MYMHASNQRGSRSKGNDLKHLKNQLCAATFIAGEVWYFFGLTHLPLEEFLGCMLVVEVPGV